MSENTATIRAYFQLFRFPNVFTALADVMMGFLFVHASLRPSSSFFSLAVASMLLYTAGMVLNDVWDVAQDRRERPERPIASGRIAAGPARRIGFGLLLSGMLFGWVVGYLPQIEPTMAWRSGVVATLLALFILLYDGILKRTFLGPLAMGSCRLLNVLLGMSLAGPIDSANTLPAFKLAGVALLGFTAPELLTASGIGVYIAGVTWFARREASSSSRWQLAAATVVMASGIALLGLIYQALPTEMPKTLAQESTWFMLLGLFAFTIVRRCTIAVANPTPQRVQSAVKNAIWSLILLDAAVALLVCHPAWSIAIVALLIPTMVLGRWSPAT